MRIKELKIQQAPTYLVKRIIIESEYDPVGVLIGQKYYSQIFGLSDDYNEANEICKSLQHNDELNKLPYNIKLLYVISGNLQNNWDPITHE